MIDSERHARRLALAGIYGPILWWLLVVVNGAITPDYSHINDYISTLGAVGAPYASIQRLNFVVLGGSIIAVSVGIRAWFGDERQTRMGTGLLGLFGLGVVLAGFIPGNPSAPESLTHVLHNLVSILAFVAGIVGIALVSRRIRVDDQWPSARYEWVATVGVILLTFVAFIGTVLTGSAFVGLTQRLFIGAMTLWVVVQSFRLSRLLEADARDETTHRGKESTSPKTAD